MTRRGETIWVDLRKAKPTRIRFRTCILRTRKWIFGFNKRCECHDWEGFCSRVNVKLNYSGT